MSSTTHAGTDDKRWLIGNALHAASLDDADLTRAVVSIGSFIATPDQVFSQPGVVDQVIANGMSKDRYCLPGPSRAKLLAAIS